MKERCEKCGEVKEIKMYLEVKNLIVNSEIYSFGSIRLCDKCHIKREVMNKLK